MHTTIYHTRIYNSHLQLRLFTIAAFINLCDGFKNAAMVNIRRCIWLFFLSTICLMLIPI